jgi:hypothetical protein
MQPLGLVITAQSGQTPKQNLLLSSTIFKTELAGKGPRKILNTVLELMMSTEIWDQKIRDLQWVKNYKPNWNTSLVPAIMILKEPTLMSDSLAHQKRFLLQVS